MDAEQVKDWQWIIILITLATPYVILIINGIIRRNDKHEDRQDSVSNELKEEFKNNNEEVKKELKEMNAGLNKVQLSFGSQETKCHLARKTIFQNIEKMEGQIEDMKVDLSETKRDMIKQEQEIKTLFQKIEKL